MWDDVCARAGLPTSSRPPLPVDRLLMAPTSSRTDAVIEATRPSVHVSAFGPLRGVRGSDYNLPRGRAETIHSESELAPSFSTNSGWTDEPSSSTYSFSLHSVSSAPTPAIKPTAGTQPIIHPILHQPDLRTPTPMPYIPPPAFYPATVYVRLDNEGLVKLKEWRVDRSGRRPRIIWTAERPAGILEHHCQFEPPS